MLHVFLYVVALSLVFREAIAIGFEEATVTSIEIFDIDDDEKTPVVTSSDGVSATNSYPGSPGFMPPAGAGTGSIFGNAGGGENTRPGLEANVYDDETTDPGSSSSSGIGGGTSSFPGSPEFVPSAGPGTGSIFGNAGGSGILESGSGGPSISGSAGTGTINNGAGIGGGSGTGSTGGSIGYGSNGGINSGVGNPTTGFGGSQGSGLLGNEGGNILGPGSAGMAGGLANTPLTGNTGTGSLSPEVLGGAGASSDVGGGNQETTVFSGGSGNSVGNSGSPISGSIGSTSEDGSPNRLGGSIDNIGNFGGLVSPNNNPPGTFLPGAVGSNTVVSYPVTGNAGAVEGFASNPSSFLGNGGAAGINSVLGSGNGQSSNLGGNPITGIGTGGVPVNIFATVYANVIPHDGISTSSSFRNRRRYSRRMRNNILWRNSGLCGNRGRRRRRINRERLEAPAIRINIDANGRISSIGRV